MRDLAERVIALTGSDSTINYMGKEDAFCPGYMEPLARVPDISRIRALGFTASFSLGQAIERTVADSISLPEIQAR